MDILLADGLIDVLNNEAELYNKVLKISRDKTPIIVDGKAAELENLTRQEQMLIYQIADLEDVREKIAARCAEQCGKKPSDMSVSSIINLLPGDKAHKLSGIFTGLSKTLKEIKEVNGLNSKLIKNSLEYIDFSINLLTGAEASGNLYGNSGQTNEGRKKKFLDVKL